MKLHKIITLAFSLAIILVSFGCTSFQRMMHVYGGDAPEPKIFIYGDHGSSIYYSFDINGFAPADTVVFFYGGTGCLSWKSVMPGYVQGFTLPARVFALNKRFVSDRSLGFDDCGRDFNLANNPRQWVADYSEFISAQLRKLPHKPRNVILVGVSEGALPAWKVANMLPQVTHLLIIGSGGYSMRKLLEILRQKDATLFDVEAGWTKIRSDPLSIDKNWYGNPYRWWYDIMDIDPLADALKVKIPIWTPLKTGNF